MPTMPYSLTLHYSGCEMVLVLIMTPPGISQNEATEACEMVLVIIIPVLLTLFDMRGAPGAHP